MVSTDVDGAAEEGTPSFPHTACGASISPRARPDYVSTTRTIGLGRSLGGQYSGQVGPVYVEPNENPGSYDREVFLRLKEFEPTFSRGGDMAQDFLTPASRDKASRKAANPP